MPKGSILVVDDELEIREGLSALARQRPRTRERSRTGHRALDSGNDGRGSPPGERSQPQNRQGRASASCRVPAAHAW